MPRVIVTTDPSRLPRDVSVLLDERVDPVHLSTGHAASQLIERIAWAISDAEEAERPSAAPPRGRRERAARREREVPARLAPAR